MASPRLPASLPLRRQQFKCNCGLIDRFENTVAAISMTNDDMHLGTCLLQDQPCSGSCLLQAQPCSGSCLLQLSSALINCSSIECHGEVKQFMLFGKMPCSSTALFRPVRLLQALPCSRTALCRHIHKNVFCKH